jgi:hypothetical protein
VSPGAPTTPSSPNPAASVGGRQNGWHSDIDGHDVLAMTGRHASECRPALRSPQTASKGTNDRGPTRADTGGSHRQPAGRLRDGPLGARDGEFAALQAAIAAKDGELAAMRGQVDGFESRMAALETERGRAQADLQAAQLAP